MDRSSLTHLATMAAFATLATAAMALPGTASAQAASVQIYGRIDVGADWQSESGKPSRKSLTSDNSRLGIRGSEDLGDGLRAGFIIEQGLNVDTGVTGGFAGSGGPVPFTTGQLGQAGSGGFNAGSAQGWSRQSILTLGSPHFGELQLGRNLTPNFLIYFILDPFLGQNHGNTQDLYKAIVRASNSITVVTPTLVGTQGRLQVAASEGLGGGRFWNASISGNHGPVRWGVGHQTLDAEGSKRTSAYVSAGQLDNDSASATRMSPSVLPVVAGDNIRNAMVGVRHDF